jgi:hypothetical protein
MKNIKYLLFVVIILKTSLVFSQEEGSYRHFPELNKYVGTWEWQSGDSTLMITFEKTEFNIKKMYYQAHNASVDVLIGWHTFSIGGKVIQSSMSKKSKTFDYKLKDQTMWGAFYNNFVRINSFQDLITGAKTTNGKFTLLEGGKKAHLELSDRREWSSNAEYNNSPHFSMPKNIIMQKIK